MLRYTRKPYSVTFKNRFSARFFEPYFRLPKNGFGQIFRRKSAYFPLGLFGSFFRGLFVHNIVPKILAPKLHATRSDKLIAFAAKLHVIRFDRSRPTTAIADKVALFVLLVFTRLHATT